MSAESPRHVRSGGPLTVPPQPPSDRSIIDAVSGFINDVTLSSSSNPDPKDTIQWARFETADINEPTPEGDNSDISPLLLILGYGSGVQVWLIPPNGEAQEVLSWRQGTVRVLRILPTPQHGDSFAAKRPLIALCDSASPGPTFCSLSFISIRGGEQVKSIKFKNQILDVLANKRSVVVSFSERFAVFDAGSLEDRMAVTTCYPCPCPLGGSSPINPLALGDRWLAYAEKKINPSKRSSGGCEGEGVTSYTATVLHAAKSLSKGLRGLGESVAQSLAGGRGASPPHPDMNTPGVVSVIDIEGNTEEDNQDSEEPSDPLVAHFIAHSESIIALKFDASGMLLVTADRRGHDFHVFRINPHPSGPGLAAVHHLYVLHRGDTTAKVQDITISVDSRWAAVSTLRGTTHVFPLSPYGGAVGVRTHTQPRVVNRLSRFHRSAGLPIHGPQPTRSGSPVGDGMAQGAWFPNPRLPPYPLPTTVTPLAQLRPTANIPTHTITRNSSGRQRLSSLSEESPPAPLLARAVFGPVGHGPRAAAHLALYLITANGCLLHLLLHPRPAKNVAKDKVCDESPVEVEVEAVWQWPLQRPAAAADLLAPLPSNNPLLHTYAARRCADVCVSEEERWLSQVEIVTHAGPHRRLWMGPQFVFKTYTSTGSSSSLSEAEAVEVETSVSVGAARSTPVNVPPGRPIVPVLIDSGSASSLEHSPSDSYRRKSQLADTGRAASVCDVQLKEDLAEAMKEDQEGARTEPCRWEAARGVSRAVDPLGTVVTGHGPAAGRPPHDDDLHTRPNDDEARFRPVVRAPAAPPPPRLFVRPLPHHTRIPVQTVPPSAHYLWPEDGRGSRSSGEFRFDSDFPEFDDHDAVKAETCEKKANESFDFKSSNPVRGEDVEDRRSDITADSMESKCEFETRDESCEKLMKNNYLPETKAPQKIVTEDEHKEFGKLKGKVSTRSNDKGSIQNKGNKGETKEEIHERAMKESSVKKEIRKEDKSANDYNVKREIKNEEKTTKEGSVKRGTDKETTIKRGKENRKEEKEASIKINEEKHNIIETSVKPEIIKEENVKLVVQERIIEKETTPTKEVTTVKRSSITEIKEKVDRNSTKQENIMKPSKEEIKEQTKDIKEYVKDRKEEQSIAVTLKLNPKFKEVPKTNPIGDDIKTEEQAWDLLLNETDQSRTMSVPHTTVENVLEESKVKSKKNKKGKRIIEETASKSEDDSFVEIHAIEDKPQENSGDLVSISTPFGDLDSSRQLSKRRSPKSTTPERPFKKNDDKIEDSPNLSHTPSSAPKRNVKSAESDDQIEVLVESEQSDSKYYNMFDKVHVETYKDGSLSESASIIKDTIVPKTKKSKSLSPYLDNNRKLSEKLQSSGSKKDLIIIDSSKEQFPEIQITRGSKNRKKSPQAVPKSQEVVEPAIEKPIKSWSSIAASKGGKKGDIDEKKEETKIDTKNDETEIAAESYSVKDTTLQDKLFEIYKRTDIVVAECDAPSELNFVEEHHKLHDLPPLEALEFGLDDFKIDTMKNSLLESNDTKVTSPICKINIDEILCSIKETTSKVIESNTFNLVDLEKVSVKREKGYNFVENEKITTQEVDIKMIDDKLEEKDTEIMEKSSDDDNTSPVLSTDSDKEDKKAVGVASTVQPSPKQTAKSKKSRRKKK